MKRCSTCKRSLPLTEFNFRARSKDLLQTTCRDCNRRASAKYYARNAESHPEVVSRRKRASQEILGKYLLAHPCVDCGEKDVRVLEFDHLPEFLKSSTVTGMTSGGAGLERLMSEIVKCEVRCRNCHAIETYRRAGGNWRTRLQDEVERSIRAEAEPR